MKNNIRFLVVVVFLIILSFLIKPLIMGGSNYYSVKYDQVAYLTALDIKKINGYSFLPIQGSDYNLKVKYFNNNSWAVSSITPIKGFSDSLTAVYEKNGDNYKTVIYPSNLILQKNINNLPSVVQSYLKSLHAVKLGNS